MQIFGNAQTPLRLADRLVCRLCPDQLLASSEPRRRSSLPRGIGEGGRTNWHIHSGPQWLFILEGRVRIQTWAGASEELDTGDAVVIPPGEKHWHGAAPGSRGAHLAINVNAKTEWLEPVTDEEYQR
jgi:mannose-6-phosphate isomerase-like protein (cupin superfamily)